MRPLGRRADEARPKQDEAPSSLPACTGQLLGASDRPDHPALEPRRNSCLLRPALARRGPDLGPDRLGILSPDRPRVPGRTPGHSGRFPHPSARARFRCDPDTYPRWVLVPGPGLAPLGALLTFPDPPVSGVPPSLRFLTTAGSKSFAPVDTSVPPADPPGSPGGPRPDLVASTPESFSEEPGSTLRTCALPVVPSSRSRCSDLDKWHPASGRRRKQGVGAKSPDVRRKPTVYPQGGARSPQRQPQPGDPPVIRRVVRTGRARSTGRPS